MMTKRRYVLIVLLVVLCLVLACFIGCGSLDLPNGGDLPGVVPGGDENKPDDDKPDVGDNKPKPNKGQLASVDTKTVTFTESAYSLLVEWAAVPNATAYRLLVKKSTSAASSIITVGENSVDLKQLESFRVPDTGSLTITFTAQADEYTDSATSTITYDLEGSLLLSPEIISFKNGIIEWKAMSSASSYTVKVGETSSTTTANTYDLSKVTGSVRIDIGATIDGKKGAVTSVIYNSANKTLSAMPITDYTLDGDILKWKDFGGATGYRVVDLDYNTYVVTTPHYIMSVRNVVYGVYPVMPASSVVKSAEIVPVDIKYLSGEGSLTSPYIIKTPFDLRAVDYYELRSFEAGSNAKNYYKIANDIDYHTVSALEGESNMFTLRKPFFGVLDGNNKTLSNIYVNYKDGFWALFEHLAQGSTVKNIKFENADINNSVQDDTHPTNPASAMVAYRNYGNVSGITLSGSKITVKGGGAAGLVIHNYGSVVSCNVTNCEIKQSATSSMGVAAYEMAGVVLENLSGGIVTGNTVKTLTISGANSNVGSSAGVVAINRKGGSVTSNSFDQVTIKNLKSGKEAGGVVAYSATGGTVSGGTLGTLIVDGVSVTANTGNATTPKGKLYGKMG